MSVATAPVLFGRGSAARREAIICCRKAPLWNQSSPLQPSTIGFIGTGTLSAGWGFTSAIKLREGVAGQP